MKKITILFVFLVLIFFASPTSAQTGVVFDSVNISLLPEYDQPGMLVIIRGQLLDDISLPVELVFNIPVSAGEPNAVAAGGLDVGLSDVPYKLTASGGWQEVTFTVDSRNIQLEYYDPALLKRDELREYEFRWLTEYQVLDFNIEIQQPYGVQGISFSPALGEPQDRDDGLSYYVASYGELEAGATYSLRVSYEKSNDDLTISQNLPPDLGVPEDESTKKVNWLPYLLGGLGLILLVIGGYDILTQNRPKPAKNFRRKRKFTKVSKGIIYCHACGTKSKQGDRYCRECGTKLRI